MDNSISAGANIQVTLLDVGLLDVIDQPMPIQNEEEKLALMRSIQERGLIDPIVVKELQNGRYLVLEGRTRLELVKKLGYKRIACNLRGNSSDLLEEKILPYELELYRRRLSDTDWIRLEKEKNKIENTEKETVRAYYYRKLSPGMRSLYEEKLDAGEISKEWKTLFFMISNLTLKEQQDFFEKQSQSSNQDEVDIQALRDTMNERIDELEQQIETYKKSEVIYKNAIERATSEFEARAAAQIKKREAELEEKYKEENLTGRKFQTILAEEKKKIEEELSKELKEETRRLKELSKQQQITQKELELIKEEKRSHDKQMKELDCILKQKRGELDEHKAIINTLANTKNINRQLEIIVEHIKNVNFSITCLGDVHIDDKMRESMANRIDNIRDICQLIENAIKPEAENKGKSKQAA